MSTKLNSKGYTLIELLVVAAIGSAIAIGVSTVLRNVMRSGQIAQQQLEEISTNSNLSHLLYKRMINAGLTFDLFYVKSDNLDASVENNLYTVQNDSPCLGAGCKRHIILRVPASEPSSSVDRCDAQTCFFLAETIPEFAPPLPISPAGDTLSNPMYSYAPSANAISLTGNLSFNVTNFMSFLKQFDAPLAVAKFFVPNEYFILTTPLKTRPFADFKARRLPLRSHHLLLFVNNANSINQNPSLFSGWRGSYASSANLRITSVDQFFRYMPPYGPKFAFVAPIKIYRIYMKRVTDSTGRVTGDLMLERRFGNTWSSVGPLASNALCLQVIRDDISLPSFRLNVITNRDQMGSETIGTSNSERRSDTLCNL